MITRRYRVDKLPEITVAMDFASENIAPQGIRFLKQVLMTKPRTAVIKRTPLATPRRYDYYNRKDGTVTRTGHTSGTAGALRKAVENDIVRDVADAEHAVTFGLHATATVGYGGYVHEMTNPREGQYWQEGMRGYGRGWTTRETGNKFVEKIVTDYADYIPEKVGKLLDEFLAGGNA